MFRGAERNAATPGNDLDHPAPGRGQSNRLRLVKWGSWFAVLNAGVLGLVALRYLLRFPFPDDPVAILYVFLAYIGQFALLAYLPFLVLLLPLTLLLPRAKLVGTAAIAVFSVIVTALLIDSMLFERNHFHLSPLTVRILGARTWGFAALYLVIISILEWFMARWVWRHLSVPGRGNRGSALAALLLLSLFGSQAIYIVADAHYYVPITKFDHYLPLYHRLTAKRFLQRHGWVKLNQSRERSLVSALDETPGQELNYPRDAMDCGAGDRPPNLLFIVVDAMRADFATAEVTPGIDRFASRSVVFRNHYSGGNSSRIGMFSLFYGIPGTYWQAFQSLQRPPVLMDVLRERGYHLGIFGSDTLYGPANLDRTAFSRIPGLRLETVSRPDNPYGRDRAITEEWIAWLDALEGNAPFFGFLYYAAPSHEFRFPADYTPVFDSRGPRGGGPTALDRYKTALYFDDSLIERVLLDLETRGLLEETIVILTSDHGEEFDDNGLGFRGHGTAYSSYQMHTPMLVHWPGMPPGEVRTRTSHLDVAPTLLGRALGCVNPFGTYSSGDDLFSREDWPWLIAGSYNGYAIIEPEQVTVAYTGGYFEVRDAEYRLVDRPVLDKRILTEAMQDIGRFYR